MPDIWLETSNSELNAFYLELFIIIFILHENGDVFYSKVELIGRYLSQQKKKRLKPKPHNFPGFLQIKHTVGPATTTVRFPPESDSLDSDNPIQRKEQIWGWTVPKEN